MRPPLSLRPLGYLWITLRVKLTVFISLVRKLWSRASEQAAQGLLLSPQEEKVGSEPRPWLEAATRTFPELTLKSTFLCHRTQRKGVILGCLFFFFFFVCCSKMSQAYILYKQQKYVVESLGVWEFKTKALIDLVPGEMSISGHGST